MMKRCKSRSQWVNISVYCISVYHKKPLSHYFVLRFEDVAVEERGKIVIQMQFSDSDPSSPTEKQALSTLWNSEERDREKDRKHFEQIGPPVFYGMHMLAWLFIYLFIYHNECWLSQKTTVPLSKWQHLWLFGGTFSSVYFHTHSLKEYSLFVSA